MALLVQKFGGTSVGSIERIRSVANIVSHACQNGHQVIVVVSAMSGETDRLQKMAYETVARPDKAEMDVLLSTGEQVVIALLAMALKSKGWRSQSMTGEQAGIITDDDFSQARIKQIKKDAIMDALAEHDVLIVAGFQGVTEQKRISTLGRGGSDLTAVALAASMQADDCEIYTDVTGVYSSDPRLVPKARCLTEIPFAAMLELASVGAKVLQTRAVYFAGKYQVPIKVLSSFEPAPGTRILYSDAEGYPDAESYRGEEGYTYDSSAFKRGNVGEVNKMESAQVSGVAFNQNETKVTFCGLSDKPGIIAAILRPLTQAGIQVDMIIQSSADNGTTELTFSVANESLHEHQDILQEIAEQVQAKTIQVEQDVCKLSVVGVGLRHDAEVAVTMFDTLAEENINILAISNSETRISVLIQQKYLELGARSLHTAFNLDEKKSLG